MRGKGGRGSSSKYGVCVWLQTRTPVLGSVASEPAVVWEEAFRVRQGKQFRSESKDNTGVSGDL